MFLCSMHFEDSEFTSSKKNKIQAQKAVPTTIDISNPPPSIAPKRLPPKKIKSRKSAFNFVYRPF